MSPLVIVTDMKELEEYLSGIRDRLEPGRNVPLLTAIGDAGIAEVKNHFFVEEGPDGPWPELSTTPPPEGGYAAVKARKAPGKGILRLSDDLINSIESEIVEDDVVEIGSSLVYAARQNYGFEDTPPREFAWLGEEFMDLASDTVADFYLTGEARFGGTEATA